MIMIGNKKKLYFLSASDRINYGDILFPIIFMKVLNLEKINVEFYNYGIVKSDLSFFGGFPTLSYRKFQKNIKHGGNIIIGGGEVLFVDWASLAAFISLFYSKILSNNTFAKFEAKFNLIRYLFSNGQIEVPYAPNKENLKSRNEIAIFYNSVGGSFQNSRLVGRKKSFRRAILSSDYISVRDQRVQRSLLDYDINSILVPDSAILLSDFFDMNSLLEKVSFEKSLINNDYLFFQIGKHYRPLDFLKFVAQLEIVREKLKCKIYLCPIGLAPMHEDVEILKEINSFSKNFKFIMPNNIYDIMALICFSKAYIGTSLHGLITAQSYNIPFIPLNKKITKVEQYCKTWTSNLIQENLEYSNILDSIIIIENWDFNLSQEILENQKKLVYDNLKNIFTNLI